MRDIKRYEKDYVNNSFEDVQVKYRRKKVLEILKKYSPRCILDIGIGMDSIINYYNDYDYYVFFEPSLLFYQKLMNYRNDRIRGYNECFCYKEELKKYTIDFVICSSLIHEIEFPDKLLADIYSSANEETLVHINVPNSNSFHRLLAHYMNYIDSTKKLSERNVLLQQQRVFDIDELVALVEKNGFEVVEKGSYFIKPFTHKQMKDMLDSNIINDDILDGLYNMSEELYDYGSEIYVNCKKNDF